MTGEQSAADGGNETILLVEDEAPLRSLVARALASVLCSTARGSSTGLVASPIGPTGSDGRSP